MIILSVAISASSYEGTRIAAYQSVNDPSKPLDTLTPARRSRAFVDIAKEIERAFERAKEPEPKKEEAGLLESWPRSPFTGLPTFTNKDAPIFFGRGRETDALVERTDPQPVCRAVVGASGSGKSSLVWAGLIPRLEANGISSNQTASKTALTCA